MQRKDEKRKKIKSKKRLRKKAISIRWGRVVALALLIVTVVLGVFYGVEKFLFPSINRRNLNVDASRPEIDVQLLDMNEYSRPGIPTEKITGIVIHYTANPGSTAQNNRDYFNSLQDGHDTSVSSHFVVGLEGEIVQCIPTSEIAYASNERNIDTISIECCHPDESGAFTDATYESMVQLTAFLCDKFGLDENAVIRHFDVTGKNCPKYFVENEDEWQIFKENVKAALER